jgi:hypothetical protein
MARAFALAAAALSLLPLAAAQATTITAAPPHEPARACAAIEALVADLNAGRMPRGEAFPGPAFHTDALGTVEGAEEQAFLHAMRHSAGRPDRTPMRLYHVYRLHRDKHRATWLAVLERQAWQEARASVDPMTDEETLHPAGYEVAVSYWLATFDSNDLRHFREAPELYPLMRRKAELPNCPTD